MIPPISLRLLKINRFAGLSAIKNKYSAKMKVGMCSSRLTEKHSFFLGELMPQPLYLFIYISLARYLNDLHLFSMFLG